MKLNVAVQMDPIARINIKGDSTFALLLEAQRRGHGLSYYTPDKLSMVGEEIVAPVHLLTVRVEPGYHFTLGEPRRVALNGFAMTPRLPYTWNRMALRDVRAFGRVFDVEVTRDASGTRVRVVPYGGSAIERLVPQGATTSISFE